MKRWWWLALLLGYVALRRRSAGQLQAAPQEGTTMPAGDWSHPMPALVIAGRRYLPVISDGYSPVQTPTHRRHLGADVMYKARSKADLPQYVPPRERSKNRWYFFPFNVPIAVARDGVIWDVVRSPTRGIGVLVVHEKGTLATWYQHLAELTRDWKKGDKVTRGTLLGSQGYSPNGDAPVHLHFGFKKWDRGAKKWRYVDPGPLLDSWPVAFEYTL